MTACSKFCPAKIGTVLSQLRPITLERLEGPFRKVLELQSSLIGNDSIMAEEQTLRRNWIRDCLVSAINACASSAAKADAVCNRSMPAANFSGIYPSLDAFLTCKRSPSHSPQCYTDMPLPAPFAHVYEYRAKMPERKALERQLKGQYGAAAFGFDTDKSKTPHG
jgi:hypothetical protein